MIDLLQSIQPFVNQASHSLTNSTCSHYGEQSLWLCSTVTASYDLKMSSNFVTIELLADNLLHLAHKLSFLFYMVWPTETMFSSLDQVPRYVAEVSSQRPVNEAAT